jgi:HK97 family phage prohead protease
VSEQTSPPRETLIRARSTIEFTPADELRDAGTDLEDGHLGLLRVLFSPVGEWTRITSMWEGDFMERFAAGAWRKTIREQRDRIRSLFQHGMDPQVGDKPLGPITLLEENDAGGYGEVPLLDTSYNRDLLPGLKAGLYGASHRFSVLREEVIDQPDPSESNPHGLPERTVKEARLMEFGPVTFPAYAGATAGVRSLTDDFLLRCFQRDPDRLREMFERAVEVRAEGSETSAGLTFTEIIAREQKRTEVQQDDAPSTTDAAPSTSGPERRDHANGQGPLALPTRPERAGLTLTTTERKATWPLR